MHYLIVINIKIAWIQRFFIKLTLKFIKLMLISTTVYRKYGPWVSETEAGRVDKTRFVINCWTNKRF